MRRVVKWLFRAIVGERDKNFGCPIIQGRLDGLHELVEPYIATVHTLGYRVEIAIKPGFAYDGASVPRILWFAAGEPMQPPRSAAALIHDWLYASHKVTRKEADWFYAQIQAQAGRPWWRVIVEWHCVCKYGQKRWDASDEEAQSDASKFGTVTYYAY